MKNTVFLILFSFFSVVIQGQKTLDFSDSCMEARIRKDLFFLASDSLGGREAGTPGEILARDYIVSEFKKAGLTTVQSNDSSFLQEFVFNGNYWDEDENYLSVNGTQYTLWSDFYPLANAGSKKVSALGKFEVSEIADTLAGQNEYAGFIVFFAAGISNADTVQNISIESKIRYFEKNGAEAVILVPATGFYSFYGSAVKTDIPVFILDKLKADEINFSNLPEVSILLTRQKEFKMYNVVGFINNNALATIVLGGHYDHLGIEKDKVTGNWIVYNGADDNASGTVAVMELARYLKHKGRKDYNYIFCAFSGEEKGLLGSTHFVNSGMIDTARVKFMLDFDMIGRLGCFGNVVYASGAGSSRQWKKIIRNNQPEDFYIKKVPDGMNGSDDYPFYQKGIPVLFFITGLHKEYHTPADDPEKINYRGEVQIIKYTESLIDKVGPETKLLYHKVNFWQTFRSYLIYAKMFF